MIVDITSDEKYLSLSSLSKLENSQLEISFTRDMDNAWLLRKIAPYMNTKRSFFNSEYKLIPTGLWLYLVKVCKKFNLELKFSDNFKKYIDSFNLDHDQFFKYVNDLFKGAKTEEGKPFKPYDYQIEAAYKLLKYKKCCTEISTSGGKTLISFILFKYLVDHNHKNILYIVPSVSLAEQSAEKYELYESYLKKHSHNWEIGILKAGLKAKEKEKVESCNILFGTFQSLCKRQNDFFSRFTACILDEAHHGSNSKSIKNILVKCSNLEYSFGVTGTFPSDDTYEGLALQSYIGPMIYQLSANDLINREHRATPIYVVNEILNYATRDQKELLFNMRDDKDPDDLTAGNKCLREEMKFVNKQYKRMKFIGDQVINTKNNSLVLFGDIKNGYGKELYDYIKENSEKNVFYVDGSIPSENREYFKSQMEEDKTGNTIIVGSIYTFGEGIDIKNLWNIFLVNTVKSEKVIRQICGRGLRQFPGKDFVVLFDICDDLRFSRKGQFRRNNYLYRHWIERNKIYKEQGFKTYTKKFEL